LYIVFVKRQREKETKVFIDTFKVKIQGEASSFDILHSICFIAFLEHLLWCDLSSNQQLLDCLFYNLTMSQCGERCLCHLNVKMLGMYFLVLLTMGKPSFILPNFGRQNSSSPTSRPHHSFQGTIGNPMSMCIFASLLHCIKLHLSIYCNGQVWLLQPYYGLLNIDHIAFEGFGWTVSRTCFVLGVFIWLPWSTWLWTFLWDFFLCLNKFGTFY